MEDGDSSSLQHYSDAMSEIGTIEDKMDDTK